MVRSCEGCMMPDRLQDAATEACRQGLITDEEERGLLAEIERGRLRGFNHERAVCYERNDGAIVAFRERIEEILLTLAARLIGSINDAIEAC